MVGLEEAAINAKVGLVVGVQADTAELDGSGDGDEQGGRDDRREEVNEDVLDELSTRMADLHVQIKGDDGCPDESVDVEKLENIGK